MYWHPRGVAESTHVEGQYLIFWSSFNVRFFYQCLKLATYDERLFEPVLRKMNWRLWRCFEFEGWVRKIKLNRVDCIPQYTAANPWSMLARRRARNRVGRCEKDLARRDELNGIRRWPYPLGQRRWKGATSTKHSSRFVSDEPLKLWLCQGNDVFPRCRKF